MSDPSTSSDPTAAPPETPAKLFQTPPRPTPSKAPAAPAAPGVQGPRRRSSLSQHMARDGIEFDHAHELQRQLPASLISNAARHSASLLQGTRRSSMFSESSLNPTPLASLRKTAGSSLSARKTGSISSIPRKIPVPSASRPGSSVKAAPVSNAKPGGKPKPSGISSAKAGGPVSSKVNSIRTSKPAAPDSAKARPSSALRSRKDTAPVKTAVVPGSAPRRASSITSGITPSRPGVSNRGYHSCKPKLTRSSSIESFGWNINTPMATTPNRRETFNTFGTLASQKRPVLQQMFCGSSPSSLKRVFGENAVPQMIMKVIKLPNPGDKAPLYSLCMAANDILQSWGYPKQMTVDAFSKISAQQYLEICSFIMKNMGFPGYTGNKIDEFIPQVLEIATLLNYPGPVPLSKTVLKSPSTPYSWPAAITFLTWLAVRVTCAMTRREVTVPHCITGLSGKPNEYVHDLAAKSISRLFFKHISKSDSNVEEELELYRCATKEAYFLMDQNCSLEQLKAKAAEAKAEHDEVFARPDQVADAKAEIRVLQEKLGESAAKKLKLDEELKQYSNLQPLLNDIEALKSRLELELKMKDDLQTRVEAQNASFVQDEAISNKVEDLVKRQETLQKTIDKMRREQDKQIQHQNNSENMIRVILKRFELTTEFNEWINRLEEARLVEGMKRIDHIPYTLDELEAWLKSKCRIIRHTEMIAKQLVPLLNDRLEGFRLKSENLSESIVKAEAELAEVSKEAEELDAQNPEPVEEEEEEPCPELDAEYEQAVFDYEEECRIGEHEEQVLNRYRDKIMQNEKKREKKTKQLSLLTEAIVKAKGEINIAAAQAGQQAIAYATALAHKVSKNSARLHGIDLIEQIRLEGEELKKKEEAEKEAAEKEALALKEARAAARREAIARGETVEDEVDETENKESGEAEQLVEYPDDGFYFFEDEVEEVVDPNPIACAAQLKGLRIEESSAPTVQLEELKNEESLAPTVQLEEPRIEESSAPTVQLEEIRTEESSTPISEDKK